MNLACLLFLSETFFLANRARNFNMGQRDSMVFRCSVYLFILPTNIISKITSYISVLLNYYISNEFDKTYCKSFLLKTLS